MKKRMRYQTFFAAALCMFGFAQSSNCNGRFNKNALKKIDNIAIELDITPCVAGDVFDYMNKGHKFSYRKILSGKECHIGCKNEAKKLEKILNKRIVNELVTICESKCYLDNIVTSTKVEIKSELVNFEKRATCDPVNKANVAVVNSNYSYGFKQYQDKGVKTAISYVNGCGPKKAVFGIDADTLKKIPFLLDGTFEPACNMHDICYGCKKGKSTCDTRFKNGMISICNKKFPSKSNPVKNAGCKVQAEVFYAAVAAAGKNAYNSKPVNTGSNCAACGVTVIKNTLVSTPFYVKK